MSKDTELDYLYDLLYDIKTEEDLQHHVEYLVERLGGIMRLCKQDGLSLDDYVIQVLRLKD